MENRNRSEMKQSRSQIRPLVKYALAYDNGKRLRISFDDILFISADRSYCSFHLVEGESLLMSFCLKTALGKLPSDYFVRIHRSHAINITHMLEWEGNRVLMDNGEYLHIGRKYKHLLYARFAILTQKGRKLTEFKISDNQQHYD